MSAEELISVEELIEKYAIQGRAEFAQDQAREAEERERLEAAFEAGATLKVLKPLSIYDPTEHKSIEVRTEAVLEVANHEGDILLGRLSDNEHSIGVLFEEDHRWYVRKYFLPVAQLCDPSYIRTDDPEAIMAAGGALKMVHEADDARTQIAVREIEALALKDEAAFIPRGTEIHLRLGGSAREADTGDTLWIPEKTVIVVSAAVGDEDDAGDEMPEIPFHYNGRNCWLPLEAIADLDHKTEVLTPREQDLAKAEALTRRASMRRLFGYGLGAAFVGMDIAWYVKLAGEDEVQSEGIRRQVFSAVLPQMAALFGYFGAGGKYWHELVGLTLDLQETKCMPVVRALSNQLAAASYLSSRLDSVYTTTYHRSVHVGWTEHKHYTTDKDGNREYSHSTWTKDYRSMWVEPTGLSGTHRTVSSWDNMDGHRSAKGVRLRDERIFNLLEADKENPEKDFHLDKHHVGFGRDAAISALSAAFLALPAAFYDDLVGAMGDGRSAVSPSQERFLHQKHTLMLAGAAVGAIMARKYQQKHDQMMRDNKYALGSEVETQITRVPGLNLSTVWIEFFGGPDHTGLPDQLRGRDAEIRHIPTQATSFHYTHGSGWDNGRSLDSIYIDSSEVVSIFSAAAGQYPKIAHDLEAFLARPDVPPKLLRVLRNAVGTDLLEAQMAEDQDEAKGGSFGRSWRFVYPIWGMMVLDAILKGTHLR